MSSFETSTQRLQCPLFWLIVLIFRDDMGIPIYYSSFHFIFHYPNITLYHGIGVIVYYIGALGKASWKHAVAGRKPASP